MGKHLSTSPAGERSVAATSTSHLLAKAGVLLGREIDDALEPFGLNGRQYLLLSTVAEHELESQLQISRQMLLDPTIVVALLDDLEQRGLVTRTRHPDDRRRHVVALTPAGTKLRRQAMSVLGKAERAFLGALDAAERRQLQDMLHRVMAGKLAH